MGRCRSPRSTSSIPLAYCGELSAAESARAGTAFRSDEKVSSQAPLPGSRTPFQGWKEFVSLPSTAGAESKDLSIGGAKEPERQATQRENSKLRHTLEVAHRWHEHEKAQMQSLFG